MLRLNIFIFLGFVFFTNSTYAQVNLNATGVGKCLWNCSSSSPMSTNISKMPDNILCNRVNEGKSDYLKEAKRRGLACAVERENNDNVLNNSPSIFSSESYSSNLKNLPYVCRDFKYTFFGYTKELVGKSSDNRVCRFALNPFQNGWDSSKSSCAFIIEAFNRNFSLTKCLDIANSSNKLEIANSQNTSNRMSDTAICNLATEGSYSNKSWRTYNHLKEYVEEAKRRGLSCGVED
ncbi:MAG: hypothetical protein O2784_00720, partial [Proteobacteria bacterium]|nr:hypothetical protein [Pseudomonadota bacterium]